MKSAYEKLGLPETAGETDIKRAYRKLAFQYHPDKNLSEDSHLKFIEITEAYEELTEGKIRESAYSHNEKNAYSEAYEEARRNEEYRRRAEEHAELKYREFLAETEEFKNAWYYHFGVVSHYFMVGLIFIFGATLGLAPVLFAIANGSIFPLFLAIFTFPLAYSIFQAFIEINKRFSLFLRDDDFYERRKEAAGAGENLGFEKKKWPYWFPFVHFDKYKYAKLALFLPLLFAIIIPLDYLLPLKQDIQTIREKEETHYTRSYRSRWGRGGGTSTTTHRYFKTDKLSIRGEANFGNEGDKLKLTYTPILRVVKQCQVYLPNSKQFVDFKVQDSVYSGVFFFSFLIALICYMGFAASYENEISAALILSYLISIGIYYFIT